MGSDIQFSEKVLCTTTCFMNLKVLQPLVRSDVVLISVDWESEPFGRSCSLGAD